MVVVESLEYSNEMRRGPKKYEHMEDLMRAADYVENSWPCFFGMFLRIHHCARDIEDCFQYEPTPPHLLVCLSKSKFSGSVYHRHET